MAKIGLEVHVQLDTQSKLFCACTTKGFEPNASTCPTCLGMPGSKPVLNKRAVEYGVMIALALNCRLNKEFFFSRKTYFYPDLAKDYQITQYEVPIGENGFVEVEGKKIRIRRVHIEEDPASLMHEGSGDGSYSLVDYNRSGIPLAEIVTEPDIESPAHARKFLDKLLSIVTYLGVYNIDSGVLKADCNLSIEGGERVEVKNVTGFRAVEDALGAEYLRQVAEQKAGNKIERETRGFDAERNVTYQMRKKESEDDYGYITDPDLVKTEIDPQWLEKIKSAIPELSDQKAQRFAKQYGLKDYDARVLAIDKNLSGIFEDAAKIDVQIAARLVSRELMGVLNYNKLKIEGTQITSKGISGLVMLIRDGKVSDKNAKESLIRYALEGIEPAEFLKSSGLLIDSGSVDIKSVLREVAAENAQAFGDFKAGNAKSMNFLIGAAMKKLRGKADARAVQKALEDIAKQ